MQNTYGYHLSPYRFSEPKINYKAGFGTSFYGAGFYITLDKNVLDVIKGEAQDIFAEYFIYTIQVDENANIVDEGEDDGLQLYADLVDQFDGDEVKASAEMVKRGIDGLLYYSEEDGHSIVFYNPKMAKIVHTEYHEGWGERSELKEGKLKKTIIATMLALGLVASAHAAPKTLNGMSEKEFETHVNSVYNAIENTAGTNPDIDVWNFKSKKYYVMSKDAVEKYLESMQKKFECNRHSAEAILITASICYGFDFENDAIKAFENKDLVKQKLKANKEAGIQKTGCW